MRFEYVWLYAWYLHHFHSSPLYSHFFIYSSCTPSVSHTFCFASTSLPFSSLSFFLLPRLILRLLTLHLSSHSSPCPCEFFHLSHHPSPYFPSPSLSISLTPPLLPLLTPHLPSLSPHLQVHPFLGLLFHSALEDTGVQDVHDRALLYYRLLCSDVTSTAAAFKVSSSTFALKYTHTLTHSYTYMCTCTYTYTYTYILMYTCVRTGRHESIRAL